MCLNGRKLNYKKIAEYSNNRKVRYIIKQTYMYWVFIKSAVDNKTQNLWEIYTYYIFTNIKDSIIDVNYVDSDTQLIKNYIKSFFIKYCTVINSHPIDIKDIYIWHRSDVFIKKFGGGWYGNF